MVKRRSAGGAVGGVPEHAAGSGATTLKRAALQDADEPTTLRAAWAQTVELSPPGTRRWLLLVVVLSIVGGFAETGFLFLLASISLALAGQADTDAITLGIGVSTNLTVGASLWIAAALLTVRIGSQVFTSLITSKLSADTFANLRTRTMRSFLRAEWSLQSTEQNGHLQDLMSSHISRVVLSLSAVTFALSAGFNLGAMLLGAFLVDPIPALSVMVAAAALFLLFRPLSKRARAMGRRQRTDNLDLWELVTQMIVLARDIRTSSAEDEVLELSGARIDRASDSYRKANLLSLILSPLFQGAALGLALVGLTVVHLAGAENLAELGAIVLILLRSMSNAQTLQSQHQNFHGCTPFVSQLRKRLHEYEAAEADRSGEPLDHIGTLGVTELSFAYTPGQPILHRLDFTIEHGEAIGIVGPSGGGKSTLIQLLLRLRHPTEGTVTADGRPVAEISLDSWYRRIAFVAQDANLYAGTVAENIAFFRDIPRERIEEAARLANLHDTVASWPEGYDTHVGERGGAVSGGQRQRICIARALASDPAVLILDEPTSALDVESEAVIQETLEGLRGTRTLVIVAHRLSTLSLCDRIMVIEDGRIAAFEPAADLARREGFYQRALERSRSAAS